jgi:hypothetical protein
MTPFHTNSSAIGNAFGWLDTEQMTGVHRTRARRPVSFHDAAV